MEDRKDYKAMTPQEQLAWLTDFRRWTDEKLPVLCALGNAWESSAIKSMEEGLKLISAFSYCRDFVQKSLMFRDFARRIDRMKFYIEKIRKEVALGNAVKTASGDTLAFVPPVQSRRRGRPTKEEQRQRMEQEQLRNETEAVAKTAVVEQKPAEIATPQQGSLFDAEPATPIPHAEPTTEFATALAMSQSGARLHLDQLAWLMSDGLKLRIKEVAGLRAVAAKEAEQAKALAENGVPQAIIEPHSRAAVEAKDKYLAIYAEVDQELGNLYGLLSIGGEFMPKYEQMCASHGISIEQLKAILKPYWEKIGKPVPQLESVTTPAPEASEEEKAQRSARLHAIRTYFMRKDTKLTLKRINKMEEQIQELKSYGVPTEEYEVVFAQAKRDFANNNIPASEVSDNSESSEVSEENGNS